MLKRLAVFFLFITTFETGLLARQAFQQVWISGQSEVRCYNADKPNCCVNAVNRNTDAVPIKDIHLVAARTKPFASIETAHGPVPELPNASWIWNAYNPNEDTGLTIFALKINIDNDIDDPVFQFRYRCDNYLSNRYCKARAYSRYIGVTICPWTYGWSGRDGLWLDEVSLHSLIPSFDSGPASTTSSPPSTATADLSQVTTAIPGKIERQSNSDGTSKVVLKKGEHWWYMLVYNGWDVSGLIFELKLSGYSQALPTGSFDSLTPSSVNVGAHSITAAGTIKDLPSDGKVRVTYKPASGGTETLYSTAATVTGETWTLPMSFNLPAAGTYTFRAYAADSSGTSLAELGTKSLAVTATPSKLSVSARTKPKPGLEMWLKASPTTTRVFTLP